MEMGSPHRYSDLLEALAKEAASASEPPHWSARDYELQMLQSNAKVPFYELEAMAAKGTTLDSLKELIASRLLKETLHSIDERGLTDLKVLSVDSTGVTFQMGLCVGVRRERETRSIAEDLKGLGGSFFDFKDKVTVDPSADPFDVLRRTAVDRAMEELKEASVKYSAKPELFKELKKLGK